MQSVVDFIRLVILNSFLYVDSMSMGQLQNKIIHQFVYSALFKSKHFY